ncbi:tyrosine-type recombinase/integrase [Rhizobium sp. IMFF44]|uniref:tyrosine-type recombinase/integrase n=1 Tax=Rhizobium sp. IMFF44 TaxID=3342350 RepID=UPI0035B7F992
MPVKPRGASWQAAVSHKGTRIRKDFPTKLEAEIWEAETKAALLSGKEVNPVKASKPAITLQQLFELVAETRWKGTKGEKTALINGQDVVNILGPSRAAKSLCYEDSLTIKKTVIARKRADATINRKLAAFSVLVKEALKLGELDKPFDIGLIKERNTRVRFYEDSEIEAMLKWCDEMCEDELRDYIVVSLDTGFRQGEVLKITKRDAELEDLWTYDTKAGDKRDVPLTARAREVLLRRAKPLNDPDAKLFTQKPAWYREHWKSMQSDLKMVDDHNYVPHVLRHTFVTNMLLHTDIRTVQELAGHKRIETTMRYAKTSAERKRLAIKRMSDYQGAEIGG